MYEKWDRRCVIFKLYSNEGTPLVKFVLAACNSIRQTISHKQSYRCINTLGTIVLRKKKGKGREVK